VDLLNYLLIKKIFPITNRRIFAVLKGDKIQKKTQTHCEINTSFRSNQSQIQLNFYFILMYSTLCSRSTNIIFKKKTFIQIALHFARRFLETQGVFIVLYSCLNLNRLLIFYSNNYLGGSYMNFWFTFGRRRNMNYLYLVLLFFWIFNNCRL